MIYYYKQYDHKLLKSYCVTTNKQNMLTPTKQSIQSNLFSLRREEVRPHLVVRVETLFLEPQLDLQIVEGLLLFLGP